MELRDFFRENPRVLLAFSGGTDSAYLLYATRQYGADVRACCFATAFQLRRETEDALRLGKELGVDVELIAWDVLAHPLLRDNPPERCYICKHAMFTRLKALAQEQGRVFIDGTNATDRPERRPGMRALGELGVRSPLRECGLGKEDVRRLSREAGLFTWEKQSFACLAVHLPTGERLTEDKLREVEERFESGDHGHSVLAGAR